MKCPLCSEKFYSEELLITETGLYPNIPDIKCPVIMIPNLGYYDTHYHKHPIADWSYHGVQEEMIVYPYLIINHDMTYSDRIVNETERIPGKKSVWCSIKKYNRGRLTRSGELRPGFDRILTFPGYLHPDTEDNLRERLKLLLLLS